MSELTEIVDTLGDVTRKQFLKISAPLKAPATWGALDRLKSREYRGRRQASISSISKSMRRLEELIESSDHDEQAAAKALIEIMDKFEIYVQDHHPDVYKRLVRAKYGRLGRQR